MDRRRQAASQTDDELEDWKHVRETGYISWNEQTRINHKVWFSNTNRRDDETQNDLHEDGETKNTLNFKGTVCKTFTVRTFMTMMTIL